MKKETLSVLSLLGVAAGIGGVIVTNKKLNKKIQNERMYAQKHLKIMEVFNQWLTCRQEGKSLVGFFEDHEYRTIAIYGMSFLGERLIQELEDTNVEIKYAIDKNADGIYSEEIEVKELSDELPEVDAIIVTAVYFFDEIEEELCSIVDYPIISLEDIVYEI